MAEEKKITIDDVKTLIVELQTETLASALKKFQGKHTPRTVAAARRIAAKKSRVKIPRNLLRQLFRLTGGFNMASFKPMNSLPELNSGHQWAAVRLGDLEIVCQKKQNGLYKYYGPQVSFVYRGQIVGMAGRTSGFWLEDNRANGGLFSLAVPWSPSKSTE